MMGNIWAGLTTRYGVINDKEYPIVLEEDYEFSTPDDTKAGAFGNREGEVRRVLPLSHLTYTIVFDKGGRVVREYRN